MTKLAERQLGALRFLDGAGHASESTVSQMIYHAPGRYAGQALRRLEVLGFVSRRPSASLQRFDVWEITDEGRAFLRPVTLSCAEGRHGGSSVMGCGGRTHLWQKGPVVPCACACHARGS